MANLNPKSGVLTIHGVELGPDTTRQVFLASPLAALSRVAVQNEPWCSWQLPRVPIQSMELCSVVYFEGQTLKFISMALAHPSFNTSFDDWSQEKEELANQAHLELLTNSWHAPPGDYQWGRIWHGFDAKTGDAGFTIHYA